jgi:hypothetical protein
MARPLSARVRVRLTIGSLLLLAGAAGCTGGGGASRTSFLPPSRPAQFSLGGVPWGIAADSVTTLIEPRGYNFNSVDADGDLWFDGVLYRSATRVYAFMAPEQRAAGKTVATAAAAAGGKLVKFRVFINTADEDALRVYEAARAELVKQYGAPKETEEEYQAPYRRGDGKQLAAIRAGKANLRTYWLPSDRARTQHVSVSVTDRLTVVVDYDGPAWERESVRRRRQSASR